MLIWGKVLGAIFGFMFGGPFGALLGMLLGHTFDTGLNNVEVINFSSTKNEQVKIEFFQATFSVMGHLARADGVVTPEEIKMATKLMDDMQLSQQQRMIAIDLFRKGKRKDFNLDLTLRNLKMVCSWRRDLLQIFMEIQFQAAYADGAIKPQEQAMLIHLCKKLGFTEIDYNRLEALYGVVSSGFYQGHQQDYQQQSGYGYNNSTGYHPGPDYSNSLEKAYKILGVDNTISEGALKKAYRKLMSQHHPDKLIAKGLPEEMLKVATEKTQEIKTAYEQIKLAKGWR